MAADLATTANSIANVSTRRHLRATGPGPIGGSKRLREARPPSYLCLRNTVNTVVTGMPTRTSQGSKRAISRSGRSTSPSDDLPERSRLSRRALFVHRKGGIPQS
jgi:hypothetical protein